MTSGADEVAASAGAGAPSAHDASGRATTARTFLVVTIAGSLVAWDIGFEYGAFDTISYRRVFTVFVVSTVVLVTTIVADDESFATSNLSRLILGLPLIYLIADLAFLTVSPSVVDVLNISLLVTFPYAVYVIATMVDQDYFSLPMPERVIAAVTVGAIGLGGFYIGNGNDRFLVCSDFELVGDFQPDNCEPTTP